MRMSAEIIRVMALRRFIVGSVLLPKEFATMGGNANC